MENEYFLKKYPKKESECVFCKVEIDNFIDNNEYEPEQADLIRKNFCNNCLFREKCQEIEGNIRKADSKIKNKGLYY